MPTNRCSLKGLVIVDGTISDIGTIRVANKKGRSHDNQIRSLYCNWFKTFAGTNPQVKIQQDRLEITSTSGTDYKVNTPDVFFVNERFSGKYTVITDGWLKPRSLLCDVAGIKPVSATERCYRALMQLVKGKHTRILDRSAYYKVSPKLKGKVVTLLRGDNPEDFRIFDSQGNYVSGCVSHPLAGETIGDSWQKADFFG